MKNTLNIEQQTIIDCPLLYHMRFRPMTETCICWGWECGVGWHNCIQEVSYELETLNSMFYPTYRVRIQADQIKEKFGILHFYFSVVVDHGKMVTFILRSLQQVTDFCLHQKFNCKTVVDVEQFDYDEVNELSKEEYEKRLFGKFKCSNVEYKIDGNKYLEIVHLRNYGKRHQEPTKNKVFWHIGHLIEKLSRQIDCFFGKRDNSDTRRVVSCLYTRADEIIRKAEKKCYDICEECGTQIGTEWSPRCETTGWIRYICDECAKTCNSTYIMNGNVMQGDKVMKTKRDNDIEFEKKIRDSVKEI